MEAATSAVEAGNESFRCSRHDEARAHYVAALAALAPIARELIGEYHPGGSGSTAAVGEKSEAQRMALGVLRLGLRAGSNSAIVRLKGGDAAGAESHATVAIECGRAVGCLTSSLHSSHTGDNNNTRVPHDPIPRDVAMEAKALLRRSAAREELGRPELSHSDAAAAAQLLRSSLASTAAAQLAGQIDGCRVSVEAEVQSSVAQLLRTALQACHRTQSALRSARSCSTDAGCKTIRDGGDGEDDTECVADESGTNAPQDHAGDRAGELLHSAHTLRLFLREAPTRLRCGAWFALSMHLGNEFGLFKPSAQDLPLNLDVSVRRIGAGADAGHDEADRSAAKNSWRLRLRSATPLLDLAVAMRGGRPRAPAAIPGNGKWEVQAMVSASGDEDDAAAAGAVGAGQQEAPSTHNGKPAPPGALLRGVGGEG